MGDGAAVWNTVLPFAAVATGFIAIRGALPALLRRLWRAPRNVETISPRAVGLVHREVSIPTAGGKRLYGWWVPAAHGAPVVVLLHGWGGNAQSLLPAARLVHEAGIAALLVDARNHGRSDEDGISSMVKFAEDLDRSLAWLRAQPETATVPVAVLGHSVGAAATLLCASRRADLAAVISIAAFAHPRELMARMMAGYGIPYVPLGWWSLRYIERAIGARYDEIAPVATAAAIRAPLLLVHGTRDRRVPVADAHAIHARCPPGSTRLLLFSGGHDATAALGLHGETLVGFLRDAFRAHGR